MIIAVVWIRILIGTMVVRIKILISMTVVQIATVEENIDVHGAILAFLSTNMESEILYHTECGDDWCKWLHMDLE